MHFHKWSNWADRNTVRVYEFDWSNRPLKTVLIQEKRCTVCNKIKARRVKV